MNPKSLIFVSLAFALSGIVNAQDQVNGSISEDIFYQHLALALRNIGPSNCSGNSPPGFSAVAPCNSIEGVGPAKAESFASDFLEYAKSLDAQITDGVCGAAGANLSIDEVMSRLVVNAEHVQTEKIDYFEQRGEQALGSLEFQTMLEWANENLRPRIRGGGLGQTDPGFVSRVRSGDIPSDGLHDMICSVN